VLPDVKIQWKDVWIGALVTALLFEIGKSLLGWYFGREGTASSYGMAGSVVLTLVWVYYASLILFFGAEFTQVYATQRGSKIQPDETAEPVQKNPEGTQGESAASVSVDGEIQLPSLAREQARERLRPLFIAHDVEQAGLLSPKRTKDFVEENAFGLLLAAVAGGFSIGTVLRILQDRTRRSPIEEIQHGSRALALIGWASASGVLLKGRERIAKWLSRAANAAVAGARVARQVIQKTVARIR
jgi:hypothetical protein